MRARPRGGKAPLPERLAEDLAELFASEPGGAPGGAMLTWQDARDEGEHPRWFQALLVRVDAQFRLSYNFWLPPWMKERGVRGILPARFEVDGCEPGVWAMTHVATGPFQELQKELLGAARVAARLIQELWGATGPDDVWLRELADQDPSRPTP